MKLYQLLQSFEFEEIFPTVNVMFPNAQLHRDILKKHSICFAISNLSHPKRLSSLN